jgi:hypothetical protein
MITSTIKTLLTTAGCTKVIYEAKEIANLRTDESGPADIIGLAIQPDTINLNIKGNGIQEEYIPYRVEIMQQVNLEDSADNNEEKYTYLFQIAERFVLLLIGSEIFQKMDTIPATKIPETKYDTNPIGWSLELTLKPLENQLKCDEDGNWIVIPKP